MSDDRDRIPRRPDRDEIDEEIRLHLEGRAEELERAGRDPEAAAREARERFGDVRRARRQVEAVYRARRRLSLDGLISEITGALRALRRRPAFALTAVLLLAIGIGLTAVMLGVLDAYLLRGLPYPHQERLAHVRVLPPPDMEDAVAPAIEWKELEEVELSVTWDLDGFTLTGDGRPEEVLAAWVHPDYFPAFGVELAMGRGFTADEVGPDAPPVAIIGHDLWQSRYGGEADVLGRTIRLYAADRPEDARALTIVGVLPAGWWHFQQHMQILTPLPVVRDAYVVRVAPGVDVEQAAARMTAFARESWGPDYADWSVSLIPMHERHVEGARPLLTALGAGVVLVLVIACANVAVLLLVQAIGRSREFALRAALGAGRTRLALRLLLEAGLLGTAGAATGLVAAAQTLAALGPAIEQQLGTRVPGGAEMLALSPRAILLSVAVTGLVTLLFGLAPLATGVGRELSRTLTGSGRSATATRRQRTLRVGLIVVELAVSLALLVGAGLTLRSALHLSNVDLGFEPEGLVRIGIGLSEVRYTEPTEWNQRVQETLEGFRGTPGIESGAASMPSAFSFATGSIQPVDGPLAASDRPPRASVRYVSPGYFDTLQIERLAGRDFGADDLLGTEPVAIVSDQLAERFWPGESPVGKSLRVWPLMREGGPETRRVVGVVAETREGLTDERELEDAYVPLAQEPLPYSYLMLRTDQPLEALLPELERLVWDVDPEQPLTRPAVLQQVVADAAAAPRALARLLTVFAAFGALLAVVGVYGVIAYTASQQRRELAVRVALGAGRHDVRRLVLGHGARLVGSGLLLGLAAAWGMARVLASQIHGISPTDPATFAGITLLLGLIGLAGVLVPARRAATVDPMEVLRDE